VDQLLRVVDQTGCRVILDHHAVRAESYPDRFRRLWETGRVVTAAAFIGEADTALEAARQGLWRGRRKEPAAMPRRTRRLNDGTPSSMMGRRGRTSNPAKEGTTQ
jgi:predicted metallo-beta-lactamase superfamily hydrolase